MTWPPFHDGARRDFARRLVERTQATIRMLRLFPGAGRPVGRLNRRFPVRPFPYHLIYLPGGEDIYVVAFAHERRKPGYWIDRSTED